MLQGIFATFIEFPGGSQNMIDTSLDGRKMAGLPTRGSSWNLPFTDYR